ncbi:TraX family protein [Paenibacillus prosopidis]|uniref:TraX protein n=1 Tax=Paenibacillus prosopidis TaxID=630520 RepID=A0A368W6E3_9BACL|nr:TraX family protein [Paenibacillus prosopidis]RCW47843.1 TraX protein [Paenibacillus prosopidis]
MKTIQFLAMLTMLIDHIGLVWFSENEIWRIIGRLALPFYAYAIVLGYCRTRDINRYLKRVGWIALISQLPYQFAFYRLEVNTVGTLFVCLLLLYLLDRWNGKLVIQIIAAVGAALLVEVSPFSYGAYAVLLVLIYRYASVQWLTLFHFLLNVVSIPVKGSGWILQSFSLFATLLIVYAPNFMRSADKIRIPRIIWRSFYPLHLTVIAIIYAGTSNESFKQIIPFI